MMIVDRRDTMAQNEHHFERLKHCCLQANISRFLKRRIEIEGPGMAKVSIPFNPDLTQNSDFLHGAILFEAADTAGFIAANSLEETYSVLTADFHINFVRPVRGEGVYAIGKVVNRGKTLIVVRSEVYSDSEKLVAAGQGTYTVSSLPLVGIDGYSQE
jgi:uncharacterized protein (TIGR00369 family)